MFADLEGQTKSILKEAVELTYFMRGSIQYEESLNLTFVERETMTKFLNEHIKRETKKVNPIY